ncbi:hypothetical protein BUALT_Bualt05G0049000 [Buddleja alternifolia]|uniref:S-acyltransferase n=1 Tax=Buddleja alternifolia TaxID=168488 RepID=A0AAV6XNP6_9LAMI|nr:hypothetical protein BUALT_Bualt05G0049000 [Buddleja alternifolia]
MDFTNSANPSSAVHEEDHESTSITVDHQTNCWGCGLRLLVPPYASVSKCGWCAALTKHNVVISDNKYFWWRWLQNQCFISIALLFMVFFICGGIWALYPAIFSGSYFCGVFHLTVAAILSISTLSSFCLAAFQSAGAPPEIHWGGYPTVRKGALENYTFCDYCSKPKPPKAHHCRSCRMCVLDMDHHCPFIGNCVGAGNHRHFIIFLISTLISIIYVAIMTSYAAALYIWPPLHLKPVNLFDGFIIFRVLKENVVTLLESLVLLPTREYVLVYLILTSVSVGITLSALLRQQLRCIYMGKTYLSYLRAVDSEENLEKDCQNLIRFFGCPYNAALYLPSYWKSRKVKQ